MNKDNEQREIKFRAWNIELEKFFYSDYNDEVNDGREYYPFCFWIGFKGDHHPKMILQQFTGLLDKNGKEIYEGDMMNDRLGINRIVIYDDKFASFHVVKSMDDNDPNPLFEWTHFEVIGNIYSSEPIVK